MMAALRATPEESASFRYPFVCLAVLMLTFGRPLGGARTICANLEILLQSQ